MAHVVFVHGIAHEQYSADLLEAEWTPALAGGVRNAGLTGVADRLWRAGPVAGGVEARMAFYGRLFLRSGQQGSGGAELTAEQAELAEPLAREWLRRAADRAPRESDREEARRELRHLEPSPMDEAQGFRRAARSAIKSLARLRWFGVGGMYLAERFLWRALGQVTRYLTDDQVREAAQAAVLALCGPETRVLVGHSLGSVVAYEAAHRLNRPLPLLVTLGSPLGLQTVVYQRLRPQPPSFPPPVRRWVNVADRNDVVAAEPDLRALFGDRMPEGAAFEAAVTVDNGPEPHRGLFYLGKGEVGRPVGDCLAE
jgi:hypothetical protein